MHGSLSFAHAGSLAGVFVVAPLQWMRSGRKEALLQTIVPRIAGRGLVGGGLFGAGLCAALAFVPESKLGGKAPFCTNEGVDDRAFRIV